MMAKSNKVPALLRAVNLGNTNRLNVFFMHQESRSFFTLFLSDLLSCLVTSELEGSKQKGFGALAATVGAIPSFVSLVSFTLAALL